MAFGDFTYPAVVTHFGLSEATADLFGSATPLAPTPEFAVVYRRHLKLSVAGNTGEKAKSEWLIAPVLSELWSRYEGRINLHSGTEFEADADADLTGFCDFLIGRGQQLPQLVAPLLVVIEAKKDALENGYGQCIAGMVGLQRFNARAGHPVPAVYGGVTTGGLWRLMRLEGTVITYDSNEFGVNPPDKLLGALVAMIESLLAVTP